MNSKTTAIKLPQGCRVWCDCASPASIKGPPFWRIGQPSKRLPSVLYNIKRFHLGLCISEHQSKYLDLSAQKFQTLPNNT